MSKYNHRASIERAFVHHGIPFVQENGCWIINGEPYTDQGAYGFAMGFKAARDRWEFAMPDATVMRQRVLDRIAASEAAKP
jgi:hypothetical protein